jgi:hypothetical protein
MNPAEITVHIVKGHVVGVIFDLLGKGVCQARKSARALPISGRSLGTVLKATSHIGAVARSELPSSNAEII